MAKTVVAPESVELLVELAATAAAYSAANAAALLQAVATEPDVVVLERELEIEPGLVSVAAEGGLEIHTAVMFHVVVELLEYQLAVHHHRYLDLNPRCL